MIGDSFSAFQWGCLAKPTVEARNRRRLEENSLDADFEVRVGGLGVYCGVDEDARVVSVLALGLKNRGRVIIGGEESEL